MSKEKIVTFIVPAYNSETYLRKCLESFCHPAVMDEIEVLLVDDGSTDRTSKIGNSYVQKYPKTFRLIYKENGGHGSALNTGIRDALGKYIKIVDSDDWVETKNLPAYVSILHTVSTDVVVTPYKTQDIGTGECRRWDILGENLYGWGNIEKIVHNWNAVKDIFTLHGITYRTAFYRRWGHDLTEHVFYEDQEYATIPCCFAESLLISDLSLYIYRVGDEHQSISETNQLKRLGDLNTVYESMVGYLSETQEQLSDAGYIFFLKRLEVVILSYYKVLLFIMPDRKAGRIAAETFTKKLSQEMPELWKYMRKKYIAFRIMNFFGITPEGLQKLLDWPLYQHMKKIHCKKEGRYENHTRKQS